MDETARHIMLEQEVERYVALLEKHIKPKCIILFGSLAENALHDWSDVDLVVIQESDQRFLDRVKAIIKILQPKVGLDLLVYTPTEFAKLAQERPFVRDEIMTKGKILYGSI
ncbi:MAG: nucleotidyltransferase domain-containing protein [Oscillochloridaceae bacterium umkhey_bin13]